jgi:hypothetical protein
MSPTAKIPLFFVSVFLVIAVRFWALHPARRSPQSIALSIPPAMLSCLPRRFLALRVPVSTRTLVQSAVRRQPDYGDAAVESSVFRPLDTFLPRHLGPREGSETDRLLSSLGHKNLDEFAKDVVPSGIQIPQGLVPDAFPPLSESELLKRADELGAKNKVFKSWIGQGYYGTTVPSVILRNVCIVSWSPDQGVKG